MNKMLYDWVNYSLIQRVSKIKLSRGKKPNNTISFLWLCHNISVKTIFTKSKKKKKVYLFIDL